MTALFNLMARFPGKSLGLLRVPIDLALIRAGIDATGVITNQWISAVGLVGLISSVVLIAFADKQRRTLELDPQDASGYFKWLVFWKYPWEFASAMAFIKALNLLISGISQQRLDDLFLGLCVLFGQLIVQFPERAHKGRLPEGANYFTRAKVWTLSRPNRLGAYIMSVGNAVFVMYALSPLEPFRLFSGMWNILLNTYLMARASKRLKSDSKDSL